MDEKERKEKVAQETAEKIDAHCFKCGAQLIFKGAYFQCPEHGRQWMPENLRF